MITDLNKIKAITTVLLYQEPEINKEFPMFIIHPVLDCRTAYLQSEDRLFDIFKEPETYKKWLKETEIQMEEATTVYKLLNYIRKPYLLAYFKYICEELSEEDFGAILGCVWVRTEFPSDETNATMYDKIRWFQIAEKKYLMSEEEVETYNSLPDKITIYRGCKNPEKIPGMSWTLSKLKARWFAKRLAREDSSPVIYTYEIYKESVLAYFGRRNENEIVINTMHIDRSKIKMEKI